MLRLIERRINADGVVIGYVYLYQSKLYTIAKCLDGSWLWSGSDRTSDNFDTAGIAKRNLEQFLGLI